MNAVFAAARASIASDGRETSTSSGRSGFAVCAEQVADGLDPRRVGAHEDVRRVALLAEQSSAAGEADQGRAVEPRARA